MDWNRLFTVRSPEELSAILNTWVVQGQITQKDAMAYYDLFLPISFNSEKELKVYLRDLYSTGDIDRATYTSQYKSMLPYVGRKTLPDIGTVLSTIYPSMTSVDEFNDIFGIYSAIGGLTDELATKYYNTYAPVVDYTGYLGGDDLKKYLSGAVSKDDLSDKILALETDDATKNKLYNAAVTQPAWAMREAKGRVLSQQEKEQQEKSEYQEGLSYQLQDIYNNPLITKEDLATKFGQPAESLLGLPAMAQQRALGQEQAGRAYLQGLGGIPKTQKETPRMEPAYDVAKNYLEGTGLAQGTRLREFIESQIPETYEETRAARGQWWQRMNQPEPETYGDEVARLTAERDKWGRISQTAPSSEYTSNTYWGPGGLAAIASRAVETAKSNLARLSPGDYETYRAPKEEEDPFQKALREKNFKAAYYRQPGTGLGGRLTPSIRFR